MNENENRSIFKQIETFGDNPPSNHEVEIFSRGPLENFHQWADGKPSIGTIKITLPDKQPYYLFFCNWLPEKLERFYLVIFPFSKINPLMEIRRVEDNNYLMWKYRPNKRGSTPEESRNKNEELKRLFESLHGGLDVRIKIPQSPDDVKEFLQNIVSAVEKRIMVENSPLSVQNLIDISQSKQKIWIEKTICHNRVDRLSGEYSLGKALWSPQKSAGGANLYNNMRQAKSGDIIIHLVDNKGIKGLSKVDLECDDKFMGIKNTEWQGKPAFLLKLKEYVELDPFFDRDKFLGNPKYRENLKAIRINHHNLFYQDNLDLRQGAYLTEVPLELIKVLNNSYKDFSNKNLPYIQIAKESANTSDEKDMDNNQASKNYPLNLILYGPPGTGKTYNAIRHAIKICDGGFPEDDKLVSSRFKELQEIDRISMVTFHQSYGYEEFVEGIRPVLSDEGDSGLGESFGDRIKYECRDGIFKKLSLMAKESPGNYVDPSNLDIEKTNIWKMSLGNTQDPEQAFVYGECIENNFILLGYGEGLDFTDCNDRGAVKIKLQEINPVIKNNDYHITSVHAFKNKMKVGDLVIISDGNTKFRAIGQVVGEYQYMAERDYGQMRPVKWLVTYDDSLPREKILKKVFSQATIYQLQNQVLKLDGLRELLSGKKNKNAKNYVLIIDEINRGNVSKVLGELITLLEPDKRLGAQNELMVTLPYSGEQFGVPGNLYIIGTMNTADRSIAFIDTALRRRFEFMEMLPDLAIIKKNNSNEGKLNNISIVDLLSTLNQRIEIVYDKDHQIGHSYLLNVNSLSNLRRIFLSEIIPLLQEYFYSDWNKICLILGCPYDLESGNLLKENNFPIISITTLKESELLGNENDDYEKSFGYEINSSFKRANEEELKDYFKSIL